MGTRTVPFAGSPGRHYVSLLSTYMKSRGGGGCDCYPNYPGEPGPP